MQATYLGPLKLAARVLILHNDHDQQLLSHIASIVSTSAILQSHSVRVTISFCAATSHVRIPTPAMLSRLAPLLQSVDLHSVPMRWTTEASFRVCPPFTSAHIAALRHSPLLKTLCILDTSTLLNLNASISEIAQLTSLTKLHLTAPGEFQASDFQPLSQLTAIEDLALQSSEILYCAESFLQADRPYDSSVLQQMA